MTEIAIASPDRAPGEPALLWRHPAFGGTLAIAVVAALSAPLWWPQISTMLFDAEFSLAELLPAELFSDAAWFLLPLLSVGSGLLASFSPCVLPLIPLNVAAIGAAEATGWHAVGLSARFVLGAAAALAVLGLASDTAGFLLIEQRGPVLLVCGFMMLYLGLVAVDVAPVPFAGRSLGAGRRLGPIAAGAAFALVTTPCASPLLGAVLAASAAQQVPGLTVVSMAAFSVGYTALVFVAGVFGGAVVGRLRGHAFEAPRAASAALLLAAGLGIAAAGFAWF